MRKFLRLALCSVIIFAMGAVFALAYFGFMSVTGLPAPRLWYFYLLSCVLLGLFVGMVVASQVAIVS